MKTSRFTSSIASIVMFIILQTINSPVLAFSPETHVWIAQEVLKDAQHGYVKINGKSYPLDTEITSALQNYPGAFLAGNIGPDTFPDPVVGQMTTHPGIEGGWQTDQFLRHVLRNAHGLEELAFAYGFIGHAAGDIFSHSYVNRYAGDIFTLTDGEETVELRHFELEKYIGQKTPAIPRSREDYSVPASFIRDTLIFNNEVTGQNSKASGTASHLVAAYDVRKAVGYLEREAKRVRNFLSDKAAEYLTEQAKLLSSISKHKIAVGLAKKGVQTAKAGLELEDKALQEIFNTLNEVNKTLSENREIISLNERIIIKQARIASDAAGNLKKLRSKVADAQAAVNQHLTDLENTPAKAQKKVCTVLSKIPLIGGVIKKTVCEVIETTSDAWITVNNKLGEARGYLNSAKAELEQTIDQKSQALEDKAIREAENAAKMKENLVLEANKKSLEAVKEAKNVDAQARKKILDEAEADLNLAEQALKSLEDDESKIREALKKVTDAHARFDPITAYISNWRRDIDRAMEEFVNVGLEVGVTTVRREGSSITLYIEWWNCWAPVFQGVPSAAPQGLCAVKDTYKDSTKWLLGQLGDGAWLIMPDQKLIEIIHGKIEKALPYAVAEFVKFTTGKQDLAKMLKLIGTKESVSESDLASLFSRDGSSKGLLIIPDVTRRIQKDMGLRQDGTFNPEKFHPAKNSVTLAKLSLLGIEQLNAVYHDHVKLGSTAYGDNLYHQSDNGRFSILFDAVRSIDGNQQWQEFALPYPRQRNIKDDWYLSINCDRQDKGCYGYSKEPGEKGLRYWVDKDARKVFFNTIFTGPQSPGLDSHQFLSHDYYPFTECEKNPFPKASEDGSILHEDLGCLDWYVRMEEALSHYVVGDEIKVINVGVERILVRDDISPARWVEAVFLIGFWVGCFYIMKRPGYKYLRGTLSGIGGIGALIVIIGRFNNQLTYLGLIIIITVGAMWLFKYRIKGRQVE